MGTCEEKKQPDEFREIFSLKIFLLEYIYVLKGGNRFVIYP
jgi:hypothetical protein